MAGVDGKSLVFLTLDRIVDRRIILEGQSLAARGCHVTVLADLGSVTKDDSTYPGVTLLNVLAGTGPVEPGGEPGSGSGSSSAPGFSAFLTMKDLAKKSLARWPATRIAVRKTFFYLYHMLQPPGRARLSPLEEQYARRALETEADIYVACDLPMLPPAYRAASKHGSLLIYDAHEFYTEQISLVPPERRSMVEVEKRLIGKAHLVVTINESIAGLFAERYGVKKPEVIYNCTSPPESFSRDANFNVIREKLSIPENIKVVLFQGGYLQGRNLEALVSSAGLFTDGVALVLLGYGEYRAHLEELARRRGRGRVHFLDAVSQEELLAHSASADLGIIPYQPIDLNTRYCTPNKFFEFIQAGLPILAETKLEELRRYIESEGIGYLQNLSSPEAIAEAINRIAADEANLAAVRAQVRAVAPRITWENEGRKFADLVEGVLSSRRSTERRDES